PRTTGFGRVVRPPTKTPSGDVPPHAGRGLFVVAAVLREDAVRDCRTEHLVFHHRSSRSTRQRIGRRPTHRSRRTGGWHDHRARRHRLGHRPVTYRCHVRGVGHRTFGGDRTRLRGVAGCRRTQGL